jgi:hypothetical protein
LSGNKSVDVYTHLNSGFLDWRGGLLRLKGDFLSNQLKRSLRISW